MRVKVAPISNVRWRMLALVMGFAMLGHFNRISMSVAGTERIMGDLRISETTMGWVYTTYLIVYTCAMTPGGWLIDRAGPRWALTIMGAGAALGVALTGGVGLLLPAGALLGGLLLARAVTGIANAPLHPGSARVVSLWIPGVLQSRANGMVTAAALVGISAAFPLFGAMIDRFGWPMAFLISGSATAVLALVWAVYARDRPALHSGVSPTELALVTQDAGAATPPPGDAEPWWKLLKNRNLALLTGSYAAIGYVEYLFFYWMEHYFKDVLHLSTPMSRTYSMIASLAMAAGMAAGGWIADWCQARMGVRRGRPVVPVVGMLVGAVLVTLGASTGDPILVLVLFSLGLAAVGATEGPFWTTAIQLGGRHGGTSGAIFNTGGNIGGLLAPVITPLFSKVAGWQGSIFLAAVISVIGAALWRWLDPVTDPDGHPADQRA